MELTSSPMTERQRNYRQVYRERIATWYNGWLHVAVIYTIGIAAMFNSRKSRCKCNLVSNATYKRILFLWRGIFFRDLIRGKAGDCYNNSDLRNKTSSTARQRDHDYLRSSALAEQPRFGGNLETPHEDG